MSLHSRLSRIWRYQSLEKSLFDLYGASPVPRRIALLDSLVAFLTDFQSCNKASPCKAKIPTNPIQKRRRKTKLVHWNTSRTSPYLGLMASTARTTCIPLRITENNANRPMKKWGQLIGRRGSENVAYEDLLNRNLAARFRRESFTSPSRSYRGETSSSLTLAKTSDDNCRNMSQLIFFGTRWLFCAMMKSDSCTISLHHERRNPNIAGLIIPASWKKVQKSLTRR